MSPPFRKSKNQTGVDVDGVVRKLKTLYGQYADLYGSKLFNLQAFQQRYRDALTNRVNLASFCHAEITVFEELKRRVQKKETEAGTQAYSAVADRIVEENLRRIRKYRRIEFHPEAEEETTYLLGAVTDFYYEVWGGITRLIKPLGEHSFNDFIEKLENDFSYYVVPMRGLYPRAVQDYQLVLSRRDSRESEQASYRFIKYGAILLNNCLRLIRDALNFLQKESEQGERSVELKKIGRRLRTIVDDFRLGDIRGY
jgi:hypothetical protein